VIFEVKRYWDEAPAEVRYREGMETYSYQRTLIKEGHLQGIVAERCFAQWAQIVWEETANRKPNTGYQFRLNDRTVKVAGVGRTGEGISVKVPHRKNIPRSHYADIYVGFRITKTKGELMGWCLGTDMRERPIFTGTTRSGGYQHDYQLMPFRDLSTDFDLLRLLLGLSPSATQGALF